MFSMMLLQSVYVYNIALGKAGMFEKKLIGNMVLWLAASGSKVKSKLWGAYFLAVLVDVCYFMLCNIFFINTVFLSITAFLVGLEIYRLFFLGLRMREFFKSKISLLQMLDLRMERISSVMFFTHALLGIICILWFNL